MRITVVVLLCTVILACSCNRSNKESIKEAASISGEFDQFLDAFYKDGLELNPILATHFGIKGYNHSFPNTLSNEYEAEIKAYYAGYIEKANNFNEEDLSYEQRISKKIVLWDCQMNLERLSFRQDLLPLDQTWSINHLIGLYASGTSAQPFKTVEDYTDWLERLDGYLEWIASVEVKMKEGIELGYVLPKSLIVKIPLTLEPFLTEELEKNLFYYPVNNFPESFSEEEKEQLTKAYKDIIITRIIPAYKNLNEYVSTSYLEYGRESSGIDGIPQGDAYYRHLIRTQTTTDLTADEIFKIGQNEVTRILQEMEKVKEKVGFSGDMKSFFEYVRNNKKLKPYSNPQEVIDQFNVIHEKMRPQLGKLFDLKPKIGFEVRRTEAFLEKTTGPHYKPGSDDGTRPGIFYVSVPDIKEYNVVYDESLFLHEAIPGHHYQISLTQENKSLPEFRRILWVNAYGEGWALYTESLGKELGLYTDPYQYFGTLSEEMHRAIRLVVDVGLHTKGWTREEAIQYSLEHEPYSEQVTIAEIERYMAFPGQALGYKIGQIKIMELRSKAEKELGTKFDIKEFHNTILKTGCVPLSILEDIVDDWIAIQKNT